MSSSPVSNTAGERWDDFLEMLVGVTQSAGGAVWQADNGEPPRLVCQYGLGPERLDRVQESWPGHRETLAEVTQARQSRSLTARFEPNDDSGNVQELRLILSPLPSTEPGSAVVELFFPEQSSLSSIQVEQSIERLLSWRRLGEGSSTGKDSRDFAIWLTQVHSQLGLPETCTAIANESRVWSGWDRVTLAICQRGRWRVESISGLERFDRRSGAVREIEQLLDTLSPLKSSHTWPAADDAAVDEHEPLAAYARRVNARHVFVAPLSSASTSASPRGGLLFEQFRSDTPVRSPGDLSLLVPHAARALEHALVYRRATSGPIARWRDALPVRRLGRWGLTLAVGLAVVLALCLVPAPLMVSGTGIVEPRGQRDVFANANGIVSELYVRHGEHVTEGAPLILLRSPELDFERQRLQGELQTVTQQIGDLETLQTDPGRSGDRGRSSQELAAKAEELKVVRQGLQQQLSILDQRSAELLLRSPLEGEVLTWDVQQMLTGRPVNRTDRLLSVARLDGPWVLRLKVDQYDVGPVIRAAEDGQTHVAFVTADAPDKEQSATIVDVAPAVQQDVLTGSTLTILADVDRAALGGVRPGTTVQYRIDCGRRAVGYVWFRRFLDRLSAWWRSWPLDNRAGCPFCARAARPLFDETMNPTWRNAKHRY